jgi:hypothetical protein
VLSRGLCDPLILSMFQVDSSDAIVVQVVDSVGFGHSDGFIQITLGN